MINFSIIIPTLNESNAIYPSLLALQEFRNQSEIILVDGGSTDNTLELARPLVDRAISATRGRAMQMNLGTKYAKGKILIFLHADTTLPKSALTAINQLTLGNKLWGRFDIHLRGKHFLLKIIAVLMNWRSRYTGIATGDQVIFVNKQLFFRVGKYPKITLMEDISLCTKLKKINPPVCFRLKVSSSGRRFEHNGVIKTILLMWSLRLRYFFGTNHKDLSILYAKGLFWMP